MDRLSVELDTSVDETIEHAVAASVPDQTERLAIGKARIGQGKFRDDLIEHRSGKCALTGFNVGVLLRASHIKPWCDSNNAERLEVLNGLLLAPGCDAAFDKRLISFEDDGTMLVSADLSDENLAHLGLDRRTKLLGLTDGHRVFLAHHRDLFHNPPRKGRR